MNRRCEEYKSALPDLLSGLLPQGQADELMRHVRECPNCRAYFEALQDDDRLLTGYVAAAQPAITAVEDEVVRSLERHTRPAAGRALPSRGLSRGLRLRLAVAAVVTLGILGVLGRVFGPVRVSTPSLAQTLKAMQTKPWVHSVTEVQSSAGVEAYEDWECFTMHITARKTPDGVVRYTNFAENVAYQYNPHSNKITIAFTTDNYMVARYKTAFDMVSEAVESAEETGATITRQAMVKDGQDVELIRLDFASNPYCESVVLIRDARQNLLLRMEQNALNGRGRYRITTTFDYPASGPADIYALGVPADALVHDIRPGEPALDLVDEIQARFERGFGNYLAVVMESWVGEDGTLEPCEIAVLRQKGELKRADHYCAFSFRDDSRGLPTLYPRISDHWPNMTIAEVLTLEGSDALERQMVFDGRKTIRYRRVRGEMVRDEHPSDQFKVPDAGAFTDSLTAMIWPNLHLELSSGSSQLERVVRLLAEDANRPGLVGLQIVRFAETEDFWFDPAKDYMLMERVQTQEGIGTVARDLVVETASTPSGQWYPAIIQTEFTTRAADGSAQVNRRQKRVLVDAESVLDANTFATTEAQQPEQTAAEPIASSVAGPTEPPAQGIHGVVTDDRGHAVADATVLLFHRHRRWGLDDEILQSVLTDPNGRYLLTAPITFAQTEPHDYAQDRYTLFALHPKYALAWQNILQGHVKSIYDLTLTRPTTRSIIVTDLDGTPIPGARVWLYSAGDRKSSNPLFQDSFLLETDAGLVGAVTDAGGIATVTNLPATRCSFHATLKGFATGLAFSGQDQIRLTPGTDVSGWVLTAAGMPIPGAIVRLKAEWLQSHFLARSDGQGRFEFTDLPAKGWDMSPWGSSQGGSGGYTMVLEHADYAAPDRKLELLPAQTIDDLVIEAATETTLVRCRVIEDGTDKPVAGARLRGENQIGTIGGYSDANGVFTVRVLPGPTSLSFYSPPNGVYIVEETQPDDSRVRFEARGAEMSVVVKSPPIAGPLVNVSGVVVGPEGVPVAGVAVYAAAGQFDTATASNYVRPTGSDGGGRFELKEVPAGRNLHLLAETKDHTLAVADVVLIPADVNAVPVVELVVQPTQSCAAVVLGKDGNPSVDTALTITPMVEGEHMWMSGAARKGRTDALGVLMIDGIVPGLTYGLRDVRFDERSSRRSDDRETWLDCLMELIPLQ